MSLTSDARTSRRSTTQPAGGPHCARCDAPLADDQEWCLRCGSARTVIHRPPSWRIPAVVIATVVVLVAAAFAIALVNLSSEANRGAATSPVTTTVKAAAPAH